MNQHTHFIRINSNDNVAVALKDLPAGSPIHLPEQPTLRATETIAKGHKFALTNILTGSPVIKYGYRIGTATRSIQPGEWVHTHNLSSALSGIETYQYAPQLHEKPIKPTNDLAFDGYPREDGSVGIRNEIWIIVTVGCCNPVAESLIREANSVFKDREVDGIFHFPHPFGCSQLGGDLKNTQRILAGLVNHPNAGGVLVMGLGCENNHLDTFKSVIGRFNPDRVKFFNLQDADDEMDQGLELIEALIAFAEKTKRRSVSSDSLVLGLKCGGSDAFSGITANPLLGEVSDQVVRLGGSAILTEVPEMFGAETILMNRCNHRNVFDKTVSLINNFKSYFLRHNQPIYENPSPGNRKGGITTLEEKSLGCIRKGGSSPVVDVCDYGATIRASGLNLLDGPGNDIVSTTALAVSGAQLVLFTTGRGTPLGGPVPTLKIASNTSLALKKSRWIDFDAGRLIDGESMTNMKRELLEMIFDVASGKVRTRNEIMESRQIAIFKDGVTL